MFAPEMQVKQYVATVQGRFGRFMVFTTGPDRPCLFSQLAPDGTQTGLQWPVLKSDLRDDVRRGLAHGVGYQGGAERPQDRVAGAERAGG